MHGNEEPLEPGGIVQFQGSMARVPPSPQHQLQHERSIQLTYSSGSHQADRCQKVKKSHYERSIQLTLLCGSHQAELEWLNSAARI